MTFIYEIKSFSFTNIVFRGVGQPPIRDYKMVVFHITLIWGGWGWCSTMFIQEVATRQCFLDVQRGEKRCSETRWAIWKKMCNSCTWTQTGRAGRAQTSRKEIGQRWSKIVRHSCLCADLWCRPHGFLENPSQVGKMTSWSPLRVSGIGVCLNMPQNHNLYKSRNDLQ